MNYHSGLRYQRGRGFGSFFSSLFRMFKPIATMGLNVGKKFIQSETGQKLTSAALDAGKSAVKNIVTDALENKNIKDSANRELNNAKLLIAQALKGEGRKRKHHKKYHGGKKRQKNSISHYNLLE